MWLKRKLNMHHAYKAKLLTTFLAQLYKMSYQDFYPLMNIPSVYDDGHNFCVIKYTMVTTPAQSYFKLLIKIKLLQDQKPNAWLYVNHTDLRQVWMRSFYWGTRTFISGLEARKLDFILRLKKKRNDLLLADTCPQAANRFALFWVWDCWFGWIKITKAL